MSNTLSSVMRRPAAFFILGAALILLAACAAQPLSLVPTAIPLAATATLTPRPASTAVTPSVTPTQSATQPLPSPTAGTPLLADLPSLDNTLVERTVADFLARLAAGDSASAFRLHLTDQAQQQYAEALLPQFTVASPRLAEATLLELRQLALSGYEARVLLRWAQADGAGATSQTMTLQIVPERGLWQIETITLGDRLVATPTPTRRPVANRAAPALTGRLAFQVSSGGDIYTINADGSGLRRLTDGLDPAWSPGGDQIALSRWRSPWGIYRIQPDGSGEERAIDGSRLKEPAWSSDGSRLAYSINDSYGGGGEVCFFGYCFTLPLTSVGQIWIADLDTGEFLSLPLDDKSPHSPAWDPARDRIVYAGDRGLAWIELGDALSTGRFAGGGAWDGSPSFSPDGSRIAFMGRVHNHWEIFVMSAAPLEGGTGGSGRAQLTHSDPDLDQPPSNVAPAWSPDGKYLAFLSNRDGLWRIYVMSADGTGQRPMFGDQLDRLGIRYEWASERVISWTK